MPPADTWSVEFCISEAAGYNETCLQLPEWCGRVVTRLPPVETDTSRAQVQASLVGGYSAWFLCMRSNRMSHEELLSCARQLTPMILGPPGGFVHMPISQVHNWQPRGPAVLPQNALPDSGIHALVGLAWFMQRLSVSGAVIVMPRNQVGGGRVLGVPCWDDAGPSYVPNPPHLTAAFNVRNLPIYGDGRQPAGVAVGAVIPSILTQFQGGQDALCGLSLFCDALSALTTRLRLAPAVNVVNVGGGAHFIESPLCNFTWNQAPGQYERDPNAGLVAGPVARPPRIGLEIHLVHAVQQGESPLDGFVNDHMCPSFLKRMGPTGHTVVINFVERSELLGFAHSPPAPYLFGN